MSNLYPPVFYQSFMPAFIKTDKCRIYFDLSPMNSANDFDKDTVQLTIQNQQTNLNVLNKDIWPSGIAIKTAYRD
jgi:hypothetical protein